MVKESHDQLLDNIFNAIARQDSGVILTEIIAVLETTVQKRTIQRRLQQLIEQNLIVSQGQGRATRYFIKVHPRDISAKLTTEGYIPLSRSAEAVRLHVAKPLSERCSVTYKSAFLYDYIPNQSFYLKQDIREHLKQIGKQPDGDKPAATFASQILSRLLVDLSWNSSRLEGNTYSLLETERLVEFGHAAEGKATFETRMILNHKAAIKFLVELGEDLSFSRYIILNLHGLLSYNLLGNPHASGRLRSIPASIGRTGYQPVVILLAKWFSRIKNLNSTRRPD